MQKGENLRKARQIKLDNSKKDSSCFLKDEWEKARYLEKINKETRRELNSQLFDKGLNNAR